MTPSACKNLYSTCLRAHFDLNSRDVLEFAGKCRRKFFPEWKTHLKLVAIHLSRGGAQAALADGWLRASGAHLTHLPDTYALATRLLRGTEVVPDIIAIDADALPAQDGELLNYISETWPATMILVYGHAPVIAPHPDSVRFCSAGELADIVVRSPEEWMAAVRRVSGKTESELP